jgi:hypothetical protein
MSIQRRSEPMRHGSKFAIDREVNIERGTAKQPVANVPADHVRRTAVADRPADRGNQRLRQSQYLRVPFHADLRGWCD